MMMKSLDQCLILVCDDAEINVGILVDALGDDYEVAVAVDGAAALRVVRQTPPDLILLDVMMPVMDGYEVLARLQEEPATKDIPVILLTALSDMESKSLAFRLGAVDYIVKPFELEEVRARVRTHLSLLLARRELAQQNELLEIKVRERTQELILTQQAAMEALASLAEHRDPDTGGHISRIKCYVGLLANALLDHQDESMRLSPEQLEQLLLAAPLHDIGKVGVPDHILLKPGRLTEEELCEMRRHVDYGREALESAEAHLGSRSFLGITKDLVYTHHERWDGKGYPLGLAGEQIPLVGRIMALADVYDALVSRRIYKEAYPHDRAVEIIANSRGTQFDPRLVDVFLTVHEEFHAAARRFADH